jgi:hypothetical protein
MIHPVLYLLESCGKSGAYYGCANRNIPSSQFATTCERSASDFLFVVLRRSGKTYRNCMGSMCLGMILYEPTPVDSFKRPGNRELIGKFLKIVEPEAVEACKCCRFKSGIGSA